MVKQPVVIGFFAQCVVVLAVAVVVVKVLVAVVEVVVVAMVLVMVSSLTYNDVERINANDQ